MNRNIFLVVDDEPDWLDLLSHHLNSAGFDVQATSSADEAMDILRDAKKNDDSVCCVISDVMLGAASGMDLCRSLKSTIPNLPVILVSVRHSPKDIEKGKRAGADAYLAKPPDAEELIRSVVALMGRYATLEAQSEKGEARH